MPVYTDGPSSGFPITSRNVICAWHALRDFTVAAVAGYPLTALPGTHRSDWVKPVSDKDWEVLFSSYDRFKPNLIDPSVPIRVGGRVFVGGYPHERGVVAAPIACVSAEPTILAGKVLNVGVRGSPNLVRVQVPFGCHHGMSGGPAAVLDDQGVVRVWGVIVGGCQLWWNLGSTLVIAKIPDTELKWAQHMWIDPPDDAH